MKNNNFVNTLLNNLHQNVRHVYKMHFAMEELRFILKNHTEDRTAILKISKNVQTKILVLEAILEGILQMNVWPIIDAIYVKIV